MKVRILMATLVITLLVGVKGFASPCDSACVDPCASCNQYARGGDLFSGLKRLVSGVRIAHCDPCDAVVACNPCDALTDCGPCDTTCDLPRFNLGGRLRGLFASHGCTPCDALTDCTPCDYVTDCDPCGISNGCGPKFSLRGLNPFRGVRLSQACATDCGPCDIIGNCDPCADVCGDTYCGPRGQLFDLPRISLGRLFGGLNLSRCNDGVCNPCDEVRPCDSCR